MAGRPIKNNAEWFSHDANASDDIKIKYLESVFGNDGYAFFFKILEELARAENRELKLNKITMGIMAKKINVSQDRFQEMLERATDSEVDIFRIENNNLFSIGLMKRLQPLDRRRERDREIYEARKNNFPTTEMQKPKMEKPISNNGNAKPNKPKTTKPNKAEKTEKKRVAESVMLKPRELKELLKKVGYEKTKKAIQKLSSWKVSNGKTCKSDYMTMINWVLAAIDEGRGLEYLDYIDVDFENFFDDEEIQNLCEQQRQESNPIPIIQIPPDFQDDTETQGTAGLLAAFKDEVMSGGDGMKKGAKNEQGN
jgi:hypothetical protein